MRRIYFRGLQRIRWPFVFISNGGRSVAARTERVFQRAREWLHEEGILWHQAHGHSVARQSLRDDRADRSNFRTLQRGLDQFVRPDREPVDGRQAIWFVVRPDRDQLMELGRLIDAGHLRPIVSDVVPLARGGEVYGPAGRRSGPGKVALAVT